MTGGPASAGGAFAREDYEALESIEERSFWFRARNELVVWALRRHAPGAGSLLEVGCGNGFVLAAIERAFPQLELTGGELSEDALAIARRRTERATLLPLDALNLPYESEFDAVGAFDVLEHIPEDEVALAQLFTAARPGGTLVVTVPQHPWLWGPPDEYAGHVRRYRRRELIEKVERAGFEPLVVTSFASAVLPGMALSRLLARGGEDFDPSAEHLRAQRLDGVLSAGMRFDLALIRRGRSLPAGGSLFAVARRR